MDRSGNQTPTAGGVVLVVRMTDTRFLLQSFVKTLVCHRDEMSRFSGRGSGELG